MSDQYFDFAKAFGILTHTAIENRQPEKGVLPHLKFDLIASINRTADILTNCPDKVITAERIKCVVCAWIWIMVRSRYEDPIPWSEEICETPEMPAYTGSSAATALKKVSLVVAKDLDKGKEVLANLSGNPQLDSAYSELQHYKIDNERLQSRVDGLENQNAEFEEEIAELQEHKTDREHFENRMAQLGTHNAALQREIVNLRNEGRALHTLVLQTQREHANLVQAIIATAWRQD